MQHDLLPQDAAKVIGVSADTIRWYESRGLLRARRTISGVRLFNREDVERFARERAAKRASSVKYP